MKKLLLVTLAFTTVMVMGCGPTAEEKKAEEYKGKVMTSFANYGYAITHEHDGHQLIIAKEGYGVSMIHHPTCKYCKGK